MDKTAEQIVRLVQSTRGDTVAAAARREAVRHFVDGVGCAAGGFSSDPVNAARLLVAGDVSDLKASAYGLRQPIAVGAAAFANACANRHLDYNDTYLKVPSGHPNDMTPALFALTEALGRTGKDFITATYLAYEVFGAISDVAPVRDRGWDQGLQCSLGIAAGGSYLMDLTPEQTLHALSLAITPTIPLRVVRTGELSQWKGCATAHAGMTAVFALRMASVGMTGPGEPFEGVDGLMSQVTGPFELRFDPQEPSALERTLIKHVPSELSSQVPVQIALDLRRRLGDTDIERVDIQTHHLGWHEIGGGQGDAKEKWDPQTRETADHSLPYIVAIALVDGAITPASFALERVRDPDLRPLLNKITVDHDPELTERLRTHRELGARIRVTTTTGDVVEGHGTRPLGSPDNPMSDEQITAKVEPMLAGVLTPERTSDLLELLWAIDNDGSVQAIAEVFGEFGTT